MPYELRIGGRYIATFDDSEAALAQAREAIRQSPDCEPEILDSETKRAVQPASSRNWREDLAKKVGY